MLHNYFFLKRLTASLETKLAGLELIECYSQNKDELIMVFSSSEKDFLIRANLDPVVSLLQFPDHFSRAGKNSVDLFGDLIDHKVDKVEVFRFERSFSIQFEGGDSLIFKMHSRRANILRAKGNIVLSVFRKNLRQDLEIIPNELHRSIELSAQELANHNHQPLDLLPALGKEVQGYLQQMKYDQLPDQEKWVAVNQLLQKLNEDPIGLLDGKSPKISLVDSSAQSTMDPIVAANWLYEKSVRILFFEKEKEQLVNQFKQKIRKSENYIIKSREKLAQIEEARSPDEIANILMANLHKIQQGLSKVVLTDFYSNAPITIKLNTALSPQKNAENYYRKSKNRHQEIASINANIQDKEQLIDSYSRQILQIQEVTNSKELRKYRKSQTGGHQKKEEPQPYHLFSMDNWQIMVGKNSKANDELTLKVARKNDLWLHAKDVPGSHVVVRERPGQNFPSHIIEYAASLAAANSKRKTDTLCPVIHTLKKYVRKVKGSPSGQVVVDKEEVVMVAPYRAE